jgi:hypothetical protein
LNVLCLIITGYNGSTGSGSIPEVFAIPSRYELRGREMFFDVLERDWILILKQQKKVSKGVWWMPWLSEAMKDVVSCDKLRLGANNRLTRRFPNGATRCHEVTPSRLAGKLTRGTETS